MTGANDGHYTEHTRCPSQLYNGGNSSLQLPASEFKAVGFII